MSATTREAIFRHQRDYTKRAEFRAMILARGPASTHDKPDVQTNNEEKVTNETIRNRR